jgi:hypothetical protein
MSEIDLWGSFPTLAIELIYKAFYDRNRFWMGMIRWRLRGPLHPKKLDLSLTANHVQALAFLPISCL